MTDWRGGGKEGECQVYIESEKEKKRKVIHSNFPLSVRSAPPSDIMQSITTSCTYARTGKGGGSVHYRGNNTAGS